MAEIVNLRMARKQKARAEKERLADANRASHGRTKVERERTRVIEAKAAAAHDGHFRTKPNEDEDA